MDHTSLKRHKTFKSGVTNVNGLNSNDRAPECDRTSTASSHWQGLVCTQRFEAHFQGLRWNGYSVQVLQILHESYQHLLMFGALTNTAMWPDQPEMMKSSMLHCNNDDIFKIIIHIVRHFSLIYVTAAVYNESMKYTFNQDADCKTLRRDTITGELHQFLLL